MESLKRIKDKIVNQDKLMAIVHSWRTKNDKVVFTNGCFDVLHKGHIVLLQQAKDLADKMIIALNTDASVKRLKGNDRPINNENDRALLIAALSATDLVVLFDEDTPLSLIEIIKPDFLVKGGDYEKSEVVGADFVESNNGKVVIIDTVAGYSTSNILNKNK